MNVEKLIDGLKDQIKIEKKVGEAIGDEMMMFIDIREIEAIINYYEEKLKRGDKI